jgi:CubicO group peptidase (beta-lactamase class C family)
MQRIRWLISIVVLSSHTTLFAAQTEASDVAALTSNVDTVAREWLASTGAPSVSIAIVRHGELAYAQAYGSARLDPLVDAVPHSRSNSLRRQF